LLGHSRIFAAANALDGDAEHGPAIYIGSADLMHRNLDRRVEALARLTDPEHLSELIELIDSSMDPTTASWHLLPDGTWDRPRTAPDGAPLEDLQTSLISRQRRRLASHR